MGPTQGRDLLQMSQVSGLGTVTQNHTELVRQRGRGRMQNPGVRGDIKGTLSHGCIGGTSWAVYGVGLSGGTGWALDGVGLSGGTCLIFHSKRSNFL